MRLHRTFGPSSLFVALGWASASAFGGDPAAESTLKEKGLIKSGHAYVIEAEKPALARIKEVKASFASYAQVAEKQAASERYEAHSAELEEHRAQLKNHLDDLNQRIIEAATSQGGGGGGPGNGRQGPGGGPAAGAGPASPLVMERDQAKAALAEVAFGQKALKAEAPVVKDKAALDEEVKKKGDGFKAALAELRPMVDRVTAKYAEIGADPAVKKALSDLRTATKAKVDLGPSAAFVAATKELDQAERRFLGKKATASNAKKKGKSKK